MHTHYFCLPNGQPPSRGWLGRLSRLLWVGLWLLSAPALLAQANLQLSLINNPTTVNGGSGYYGNPIEFNNALYVQYLNANGVYQLAKYDGTSLTLIDNPTAVGNGKGYVGNPIVFNNALYVQYQNANGVYQLAKYDGASLTLIANPTTVNDGQGYVGNPIVFNNALYVQYLNAGVGFQLAKYDGVNFTRIANPTTTYGNQGYQGSPIVFNNALYVQYRNAGDGYQLAKYDGTSLTLIANPDAGYGYYDRPIVFNNALYVQYQNANSVYQLAKYDGTSLTLIANPDAGYGYYDRPIVFNNALYVQYQNANSVYQLAKYDGTNLTLIDNPTTDLGGNQGYLGNPIVFNNALYVQYQNADLGYQLAKYNGTSLTLIANPDAATYYSGYVGNPIVFNNALYVQYANVSGVSQLAKYDGTNLILNANPDAGYGYYGSPIVFNNALYGRYQNANSVYQLVSGVPCSLSVSITATPSQTITSGSSVTLTASGATSYTWSDGSTTNPLIVSNVTSATAFSVTGVTGTCSATASVSVSVTQPPTIAVGTATGSITACQGTASASPAVQSFTVGGANLTDNMVATAPAGFEISTSVSSGYATSLTLSPSNGAVSATLFVRSSASAPTGTISGTVSLASTGATLQTVAVSGTVTAASPDYQPLVDLYNATNGAGWMNNSDWLTGCSPCGWYGVSCDANQRVTGLFLNGNQLSGSIPASLSALTNLTTLLLYQNQLSGSIPASLGALTNLTTLNLSQNQLSGSIPESLSALTNLTGLNFFTNQLSGSIPASLSALTNLTAFLLYQNQLSGSIPESLGALTNLTTLNLNTNQLSGSIPASLSALTNLTTLNLGVNQLSGSIPASLSALTKLTTLYLGVNQLSGSIPASLSALTKLTTLNLGGNQLSGSIPASLGALTKLTTLFLYINKLSGCFPASLSALCGTGRNINFTQNPALPGGGDFDAFCTSGAGSDAFTAGATASSTSVTAGGVISLTATGGTSYSWIAPAGATLSSPATATVVSATLNSAGLQTFTVVVSNGGSCTATATASVSVSATPPIIAAVGPATVCQGNSLTIAATTGCTVGTLIYTYASDDNPTSTTASPADGNLVLTATGAYTVTAACAATGPNSVPIQVQINTNPTVKITGGDVAICAGQSLTLGTQVNFQAQPSLDASPNPYSYVWSPGRVSQNDAAGTAVVQPLTTTAYTVKVTDANNCSVVSAPVSVTVNALPSLTITANPSLTINSGQSTTLTASGANSYSWSTGATTAAISTTIAATYSVTGTTSGCSSQTSVTVYQRNCQTSIAASATAVCVDKTVSLTATAQSQVVLPSNIGTSAVIPGPSYSWVAPAGATLSSTSTSVVSASFTTSGVKTFTATVTTVEGCVSTNTVSVTVNALPSLTITANPSLTINSGQSTTLTASGANSYSWSTGESTPMVSVTAGVYSVTGTSASGCSSQTSVTVYQRNCQTSIAASATAVCVDKTVSLTATAQSQVVLPSNIGTSAVIPGPSYSWVAPAGATLSSTSTSVVSASFTTSGVKTFTATVTTVEGCVSSNTVSVTVNALPVPTIAGNLTLCVGQSTTLTASEASSYAWNTGETTPAITVSPTSTTAYSVTLTNASGCVSSTAVTVTVNPLPLPTLSALPSTTLTGGLATTLTAGGGATYAFAGPGLIGQNPTAGTATANQAGVYSVTVTSALGCSAIQSLTLTLPQPLFTSCGSPTATLGQPLQLVEPAYNCATGLIQFRTIGGDGSPITYSAIGITSGTSSCTAFVSPGVAQDIRDQLLHVEPFTLVVVQNGQRVTYSWNALAACAGQPAPLNLAPIAPVIPPAVAQVGTSFSLTVPLFSDPNGDALTYNVVGLPANGLSFDAGTRLISGTPSTTGLVSLTATASDPAGLSASVAFSISVVTPVSGTLNMAPVAPVLANQSATVGTPFAYAVPAFVDPNGDALTYSVTGLPANGLSFDASSRLISGTPSTTGVVPVSIIATDPGGLTAVASLSIVVSASAVVGGPLVLLTPTYNCQTGAFSFRSSGGNGGLVEYRAVGITDWTATAGGYTVLPPSDAGPFILQARQNGVMVSLSFDWKAYCSQPTPPTENLPPVASAIANQTANVGAFFTLTIPAFTDPNGDALTYQLTQVPPTGLSFNVNTRVLSGVPSATGVIAVSVVATDPGGLTAVAGFSITVGPAVAVAPGVPGLPNQTGTVGTGFSYQVPAFSGTGPISYTATGLPVGLSFDAGTRTITGTPTQPGVSTVVVTAANGVGQVSGQFTISISGAPTGPSTLTITSFTCNSPNSVLSSVDFVVGYTNGGFSPAVAPLLVIGVTASGELGTTYRLNFDPNQNSLAVQDNASRSVYFVWNFRDACASGPVVLPPVAPQVPLLPNQVATVGSGFSYVVPSFGGTAPVSYSATGLPAGLSFDAGSRTISGVPSVTGISTVVISASNAVGVVSGQFTMTVSGSVAAPTGPATLGITSYSCNSTNGVLSSVDFVVGYSDGSFSPSVPPLFVNGVTDAGVLGQSYRLNFDPNQNSLTVADNANRSQVYFVWNFRVACASAQGRLGVEPMADWSVSVLGNPPVSDYAELAVANGVGRTLSVSVVDVSGHLLRQTSVDVTDSVQRVRVKLGATGGMYLLQISDGARQQTLRVLRP